MKLVELLAKELAEWPEDAVLVMQDNDLDKTIWFLSVEAQDLVFTTEWRSSHMFDIAISQPSGLAHDYKTAIVTREMWQAERDRQKGGEWKRHRGGSMPKHVNPTDMVECKRRDGEVTAIDKASAFTWPHKHCLATPYRQIMAYRVISQPQAEEVEVKDTNIGTISYKVEIDTSAADQAIDELAAKWGQLEGPIKWRDTIIHCQAIIEDCEREIQRNVDLLDAEGLMMQKDSRRAMQHYESPALTINNYRDWQEGDLVTCKVDHNHQFTKGRQYEVTSVGEALGCGRVSVLSDDKGAANGWLANQFKFHSRP